MSQDQETERMLPPSQAKHTAMYNLTTHRTLQCVPHLQNTAICSPALRCCDVSSPTLMMLKYVLSHPQNALTSSPPTSGYYDVLSPTLRHRMMGCVLLRAQVTEQAAAAAEKVDQHHLPPSEEVVDEAAQHRPPHIVEEAAHQLPLLPGQLPPRVDEVRDKLAVTDDQGELAVRGFSSSFISSLRRFLPQLLLPSFSYFQTPSVCPAWRLHNPAPHFLVFPAPPRELLPAHPGRSVQ